MPAMETQNSNSNPAEQYKLQANEAFKGTNMRCCSLSIEAELIE